MKKITLKRIAYDGFYGQRRTIDFSPTQTIIRGNIKLGKTTIINAFMWCLLGVDLEGRANYMLFDQKAELTRENPGQARVEVTLDIDGVETTFVRTAKQKWVRDAALDRYVKASTDTYKYYVDDIELAKGDFDKLIESKICDRKKLMFIANIAHWEGVTWRALREAFQSIVGEVSDSDLSQDYSAVMGVIESVGLEKARQEYQSRATKYNRQLEKLCVQEETARDELVDGVTIDSAQRRMDEIRHEIADIDARQANVANENADTISKRNEIASKVAAKTREIRGEIDAYNDAHTARLRSLREAYNDAVAHNRRAEVFKATADKNMEFAKNQLTELTKRRDALRVKYKEARAKVFDGKCPTCGAPIAATRVAYADHNFRRERTALLAELEEQGLSMSEQITYWEAQVAHLEEQAANSDPIDTDALLDAYHTAEMSFVEFGETARGKQLTAELAELEAEMPPADWNADVAALLERKGALQIELQQCAETCGMRMSNERALRRIDEIVAERAQVVKEQSANAKLQRLVWEYERELAEIVKVRVNKLTPPRTKVIMAKVKKDGSMDFDVCQVEINGCDATATNTADRMNAGIDVSTVFARHHDLDFPLFVDGAESNTAIETYGRQLIATVVDENFNELTIEKS